MKRILSICITLLSSFLVISAQIRVPDDGNSPIWYNNSNVGIGTQNPIDKLDVNGDVFLPYSKKIWSRTSSSTGYNASLTIFDSSGDMYLTNYFGSSSTNGRIYFQTSYTNNVPETRLTITKQGDIGVGTINPTAMLSVFKNAPGGRVGRIVQYNSDAGTSGAFQIVSATEGGSALDVGHWNNTSSNWSFRVFSNSGRGETDDVSTSTFRFGVRADGNVGIGTINPGYRLDVSGTGVDILGTGNDRYQFHVGDGTRNRYFGVDNTSNIAWDLMGGVSSGFAWITHNGTSWGERMRIHSNGNVGIGTTNPGSYRLNVVGKIRAEEVVVNTTGADFVFDHDYDLPGLAEVEKYIKENKRLPGIESANEMQKDGMYVSEMQAKLLQKIEELTLYAIEQKKEIESLKQAIKELINK